MLYLLLTEIGHFSLAALGGLLCYKKFKKHISFILVVLSGFFIDADHLIDYLLGHGFSFDLFKFLSGQGYAEVGTAHLFFHAWEWLPVLLVVGWLTKKHYFFYPLALGLVLHLTLDQFTNPVGPLSYFMTFRVITHFSLAAWTRGTL